MNDIIQQIMIAAARQQMRNQRNVRGHQTGAGKRRIKWYYPLTPEQRAYRKLGGGQ